MFDAFNERRVEVLAALAALERHAGEVGARSLAQRIARELSAKLADDRFNLVVVGEFNHGKTTFVNALLGADVLPVGVTPTTAVIHHVVFSEEAYAECVPDEGEPERLQLAALKEYVANRHDGARHDDDHVRYLEVGYPAELLRDRIVLVDTPGVNDLCLQRADITYKYIPRADAVLFVIDAGQPLKESERVFLKEKLIAQSRDKIVFVVTKADIWSDDERDEALEYVREELTKLVAGPVVFAVSAEQALSPSESGPNSGSGMPELVAHLTAYLAEERGRIMLDNALGEGLEAAAALLHGIDARRRTAKMSRDEIARRIARIELDLEGQQQTIQQRRVAIGEEAASIRAWVRRDLDRFCDDVIRQLEHIVAAAEVEALRQHLPGFLEATFVEWAQRESEEVARALEDLAERTVALMRDSAHEAARRLSDDAGEDVAPPDIRVDTFGYDLGVAALFSVGVGLVFTNLLMGALMAGAAPVLAYYLRGRIELQTRDKAR
ncbi:MAG TPA: hypothetical protein ENK23_01880, partial [Sorangium sp.]|nr:hypothetical protein [Sorangium sp.]